MRFLPKTLHSLAVLRRASMPTFIKDVSTNVSSFLTRTCSYTGSGDYLASYRSNAEKFVIRPTECPWPFVQVFSTLS